MAQQFDQPANRKKRKRLRPVKRARTYANEFWITDKSLSALLFMLVVFGLVLPPLRAAGVERGLIRDVIFSILLFSAIAAVWSERSIFFRVVAVSALSSLAIHWITWFVPMAGLAGWTAAADAIVLAVFAFVVLARVVRPGTITGDRIQGAIVVYLLLGLAWANAYEWINLRHPGAFSGAGVTGTQGEWIYYSFITLTTVGYGDISPVHATARTLAVTEALTGQLYIAILISRLVALEIAANRSDTSAEEV